jgi:uncharacterized protein
MQNATKRRFTFESEGDTVHPLPAGGREAGRRGPGSWPAHLGQGASGRDLRSRHGRRGYAALAFDYRYFGESGGRPRRFESPEANIEDIMNAATALLADDRLTDLPLLGLGVCFGAGPGLMTARSGVITRHGWRTREEARMGA